MFATLGFCIWIFDEWLVHVHDTVYACWHVFFFCIFYSSIYVNMHRFKRTRCLRTDRKNRIQIANETFTRMGIKGVLLSVKVVLMAPLKYNTKINILWVVLSC